MLQLEDKKIIKEMVIDRIKDVSSSIKHIQNSGGFFRGTLNEYIKEKNQLIQILKNL